MQPLQYKNIVAFRNRLGGPVAFHTSNLEVAEISEEAMTALKSRQNGEALSEIEAWSQSENPNLKSGKLTFGVKSLSINITQICNLHCVYCAAGGDGTYGDPVAKISIEKTLPQIDFFLEKAPAKSAFTINFIGGEPLLYPAAIVAIGGRARELAAKKNIKLNLVITTNGTLLNQEMIDALSVIEPHLQLSMDGPPEINDRQRPTKNGTSSSELTVKGLKLAIENRDLFSSISLSAVFDKNNAEAVQAYQFFSEFPIDQMDFTFSHTETDNEASLKFHHQMQEVAALAFARGGESELTRIKSFKHYFNALDEQQQTENFCGSGKSLLVADSRNQLYACPWAVGNKDLIVGQGNEIDETKLAPLQEAQVNKDPCQACWARHLCGGGCMVSHKSQTGDITKVDKNFCDRTQALISSALLYYVESRAQKVERNP